MICGLGFFIAVSHYPNLGWIDTVNFKNFMVCDHINFYSKTLGYLACVFFAEV